MALAHKFSRPDFDQRRALITAARNAIATNQTTINAVVGSTVTQSQNAIKRLAQHQNGIIRAVVGEII